MTTEEASERTGLSVSAIQRYARRLGLGRDPTDHRRRNLTEADIDAICELRRAALLHKSDAAAETCQTRNARDNPNRFLTPEQRQHAGEVLARARRALCADWRTHPGEFVYAIAPTVCADPELSSRIEGGPLFVSLQWHATGFYPDPELDAGS